MSSAKVLLIEDDRDYSFMLSELLNKRFHVQVVTAGTVDEGEAWLEKEEFDIVISDVQLPGRSGVEVIQVLLRLNKSIPLIFFTASDLSQQAVDRHGYPCVVVNKKDHRDLLQIASNFLGVM